MKRTLILPVFLLTCILVLASGTNIMAQEKVAVATADMPLPEYNCNFIDSEIQISGKIDDPSWKDAEVILLNNPIDGKPGRFVTKVRMLYNTKYLYVSFECEDDYVWGTLSEHDAAIFTEECVEMFLCPSGKMRQYYELNVSPLNTMFDTFILNGRPITGERAKMYSWTKFTCDGMIFPQSCTSPEKHTTPDLTSPEVLLTKYQECLGGPFPEPSPLNTQLRETIQKDGYRIESVTYEVQPGEQIPALILIPDNVTSSNPVPGIAIWHQHNGEYHLGKSEPAGRAGNPMHHTAVALVREGYVVLCPDSLCFEERQDPTRILKKGEDDTGSPIESAKRGLQRIAIAYQNAGIPDTFTSFIEPGKGHVLSDAMWQHTKECFARHLKLA